MRTSSTARGVVAACAAVTFFFLFVRRAPSELPAPPADSVASNRALAEITWGVLEVMTPELALSTYAALPPDAKLAFWRDRIGTLVVAGDLGAEELESLFALDALLSPALLQCPTESEIDALLRWSADARRLFGEPRVFHLVGGLASPSLEAGDDPPQQVLCNCESHGDCTGNNKCKIGSCVLNGNRRGMCASVGS